jgi:hypothetical protein
MGPAASSSYGMNGNSRAAMPAARLAPMTRTQTGRTVADRPISPTVVPTNGFRGRSDPIVGSSPMTSPASSRTADHSQRHSAEGVAHIPETNISGGATWRSERLRETTRRNSSSHVRTGSEGTASIPERARWDAANNRRIGDSSIAPHVVPKLDRLPRQAPMDHARTDLVTPNLGRAPLEPITSIAPIHSVHTAAELNCAFANPCNHFCSWHGCTGFESGFFFCSNSLFCYWLRPGCAPCFYPYTYYYWPSCYYLPAYYPSYADVVVVHEYSDDGAVYAPLSNHTAPPRDANPTELVAKGWELFRARDYPGAVDSFRDAVLTAPNDATAKVAYAQALFAIGNYADAAFLLRRATELQPDLPVLGEDPRGRYADPEDHAEQMLALRGFLDRVKGEPAAMLVLAWQSYFTGDLGVARESFDVLKSLDPEDATAKRFLERLAPAGAAAK